MSEVRSPVLSVTILRTSRESRVTAKGNNGKGNCVHTDGKEGNGSVDSSSDLHGNGLNESIQSGKIWLLGFVNALYNFEYLESVTDLVFILFS